VLTPTFGRKFKTPERLIAFVPITAPITPTSPNETAPKTTAKTPLSAAAAAAAPPVELKEADALALANKLGIGVPERLIIFIKDGEKLSDFVRD